MKNIFKLFILIFIQCLIVQSINAQASLSIQGILKKSNGVAVDDGVYTITFRLYEQETGSISNAIWSETQNDVEVFNGIYSAVLGQTSTLNVPFDQLYYLGVTIGSTEMTPRILLTSAPYALSLIGATNQFPSSGKVLADSILVDGGVLASGGAPGVNGENRNGYAFSGENGDKDSGLFSTGDGKASLYSNNTEVLAVTQGAVTVNGDLTNTGTFTSGNVDLLPGGTVKFNGISDWRLVDVDDFQNGNDGWKSYSLLVGQYIGWNNPTGSPSATIDFGGHAGVGIKPGSNNDVLKKLYNITGSYTQIKVKFRYYYLDTWNFTHVDAAFAGFSQNENGTGLRIAWHNYTNSLNQGNAKFDAMANTASFFGDNPWIDEWASVEMTAQRVGDSFWVFIGSGLNETTADETYAVGAVEIWVR